MWDNVVGRHLRTTSRRLLGINALFVVAVLVVYACTSRYIYNFAFGPFPTDIATLAEQPDPGGAGLVDMRQIDREAGIDHQRHGLAVLGQARLVAQRQILQLPARAQPHALHIGGFHVGRGTDMHVAGGAVHDDRIARIDDASGIYAFLNLLILFCVFIYLRCLWHYHLLILSFVFFVVFF